MVAVGVLSGTPSHAGEGEPTSSTSSRAASRSNSDCGISMARPVRKTNAVQVRLTFCGAGGGIELVGEKWKVEGIGFGVVESDEAILRVQNLLERLMNAEKQLVEVGGFVQRVDDVGDDLALFLHALKVGDVEKADNDGLDTGIAEVVLAETSNQRHIPSLRWRRQWALNQAPGDSLIL